MDGQKKILRKKNPRENANPLSALTFSWILKTFWVGYRRDLEIQDLTQPLNEHKSSIIGGNLTTTWNTEVQRLKSTGKSKTPSLLRAIFRLYGVRIFFYGVVLGMEELILLYFQPRALALLLGYFSSSSIWKNDAYFHAAVVIFCSAIKVLMSHASCMAAVHMGMKLRVACCSLIYRKSLKLSTSALAETTAGQAMNLISNDVMRFDYAVIYFYYLFIGPIETVIITYLMYQEVDVAAFIGIFTILMFIPLQGFLGKKASSFRLRSAVKTDKRVSLTDEIIRGIQAIKMYAWELPFSDLIAKVRGQEMKVIRMANYLRGIFMSFMMFSTRLSLFVTILAYVCFGNRISAEKVFMLTAYYNILRETMTITFPYSVAHMAETFVSIKRLEAFLMLEEVTVPMDSTAPRAENNGVDGKEEINRDLPRQFTSEGFEGAVKLEKISAKWSSTTSENTLKEISISVQPGQLVAVVGQVGSGKSSLFNVILRELPTSSGVVSIPNRVSYASQEPWLFAASVRQNILFGRPLDQKKYDQVVRVCQLRRDFSLLPFGDRTIVSDRGISLSGGQRARINLARAVYADAPLYLLDDPLSAVDAHVGKHIFEECIEKYLSGRTRILVTHQVQFLKNVEKIIVMRDGKVVAEGTYDELSEIGVDFGTLLETAENPVTELSSNEPNAVRSRHPSVSASVCSSAANETPPQMQDEPEEIAEMRTKGEIKGHVWMSYCKAGGGKCVLFIVAMLFVGAQLCGSGGDYFIAYWVDIEQHYENVTSSSSSDSSAALSHYSYIYIFCALMFVTILVTFIRSFTFFHVFSQASKRLHDQMFRSVIRSTMRFFNTNTSGRILNRFSKDLGAIDEILPICLIESFEIGLFLLGIILVVGAVNPWLLLPALVIGLVFYVMQIVYLTTSRSTKRLEGVTRSPVFSHFNATLQGLTTIRSFQAGQILTNEFDNHQDLHSSAFYLFSVSSQAFGFWLDICCLVYIALVTMSFLVLAGDSKGGDVGLAITQSIGLTGMLQWGMRQSAELINQMTSVERVLEYTTLESEPPLESQPKKKPWDKWPEEGKIEFKSVQLTYAPLEPPVLKNLNFTIEPRERVGIVGRTGAGKSSLIAALFRLADIEGKIEIDGVDTGDIGLHDLRSKISIIPQEPFLFAGSLRKNLDPFEQYTDGVLWAALEDVELKEMGLEMHVSDGGGNLSVGQRQLVCLARAIVRNNRILVLDEATANVDLRTDELIQETIRRKFTNCTVLTIAHRLNTVMDSDRILVMDGGSAVEFDHPHVLLQNREGYLFGLVQETGETTAEALTAIAREKYKTQNSKDI